MANNGKPMLPKKVGLVVAGILVIVVLVFVGMNIGQENESDAAAPTSANPHAVDQAQ